MHEPGGGAVRLSRSGSPAKGALPCLLPPKEENMPLKMLLEPSSEGRIGRADSSGDAA